MSTIPAVTREMATHSGARNSATPTNAATDRGGGDGEAQEARNARLRRAAPVRRARIATDDEILGLDSSPSSTVGAQHAVPGTDAWLDAERQEQVPRSARDDNADGEASLAEETAGASSRTPQEAEPAHLRAALEANPELRAAWQDANSYRESFATPEEARAATALLGDLDRMDALFFSRRPEDHAELARSIARLDPEAFASLAHAMSSFATETPRHGANPADVRSRVQEQIPRSQTPVARDDNVQQGAPTAAQVEFFHAANAAAVRNVLDAIETQVERLLPESVSKNARNRVVGEIYRELDGALRSNRQLGQQMRDAFRSGALDADHQRALVSLITGRARQALPGVAKRVLNEWTSTVIAANQDRRARQRAAESRVDIAGSGGAGNDGRRSLAPRDIDYARLSDSDILNM